MKVEAIQFYECTDERLITDTKLILNLKQESEDDPELEEQYRNSYKFMCDIIRKSLNTKNLVGFALNKEEDKVGIWEFDKVAGDNDFYDIVFEEGQVPYIEDK